MNRFLYYLLLSFISFAFVGNSYAKETKGELYPDKTISISKKTLKIAMFLPLAYDKIEELDFTKFNIEEKKRIKYRCFEYIAFYEGARIALEKLEAEGYAVSLYVYDVGEDDINQMKSLLSQPEIKTMDLIIPLVFQQSFALVSEFSNANKIPIINPMSPNYSIIENNPYTFKIQPSDIADVETTLRYIKNNFPNPNITLIFTSNEKNIVEMYQKGIEKEGWSWLGVDYNKYARRIFEKVDLSKDNIFISVVEKGSYKMNEAYANTILSQFNNKKNLPEINFIAQYSWLDFPSIDLSLIQKFNFHFTLSYLNDYTNANFVDFVKDYRHHFRQEPDKIYAALGYDIMMFFVPALAQKGDKFINEPNVERSKYMINSFFFDRKDAKDGWQNRRTVIYKINDYKIISVGR
ncbi:MAG: hypothetical protein M0O93_04430 [Bacteroidales bacterium]|nr:hypothetical protein [Bacteroidales bacterium]